MAKKSAKKQPAKKQPASQSSSDHDGLDSPAPLPKTPSPSSRFAPPKKRVTAVWASLILLGVWMASLLTLAIVLRMN